jgi:hypothetical protein
MLPPRVIDLIWLQAGLKFDANVNSGSPSYDIVATMDVTDLHPLIVADIERLGSDDGAKLISCVGKYWCLINELPAHGMVQGDWAACNYGWFAKTASGPGLTAGTQCWQRPGYAHNKLHIDPSQTIRLMWQQAKLSTDGGKSYKDIGIVDVAADAELAPLIAWDKKPLKYLRQKGVDKGELGGQIVLPPVVIRGGDTDPKAEPQS